MAYQVNFKRYELKYLLTVDQKLRLLMAMEPHMRLDEFGRCSIRNLYYDTDSYRLIRSSIERPTYKEKLRVRSYGQASADGNVFVELKKKYKGVVYKRRVGMPQHEAMRWLGAGYNGSQAEPEVCGQSAHDSQVEREIKYFLDYYNTLHPTVFLSYDREAYYALDGSDFRVTFDDNILVREDRLSLKEDVGGTNILEDGMVLMEIKCSGGIPLWMTHALTQLHIYKGRFSKYGTAYQNIIYPRLKEEYKNGIVV